MDAADGHETSFDSAELCCSPILGMPRKGLAELEQPPLPLQFCLDPSVPLMSDFNCPQDSEIELDLFPFLE
jgi:hypothetical protein